MDSIKGAIELTRRLAERHQEAAPIGPDRPLENQSAALIYHWLGIEPPDGDGEAPDGGAPN